MRLSILSNSKRLLVLACMALVLAVGLVFGPMAQSASACSIAPCSLPGDWFSYGTLRTVVTGGQKTIDMPGASLTAGVQFEQFSALVNHPNQQFAIYSTGYTDQGYLIAEIRVAHSGFCMDVSGASTSAGAAVVQWPCNGQANQRFILDIAGDNNFHIQPLHSRLCLDVKGGSLNNGAKIQQWTCNGTNAQLFYRGSY